MRREVDLVDHQQVASGYSRAAFPRDFVPLGYVDNINCPVGELRRKSGGPVVAAGFDNDCFKSGEFLLKCGDGGEVDAGVLSNGAMRAAARFHSNNPL